MEDLEKNAQCQMVVVENISENNMRLMIEPWGEEVQVGPEKRIVIHGVGGSMETKFALQYHPDYLIVLGYPEVTIHIEMDGEFLKTGSREFPIPKVFFTERPA